MPSISIHLPAIDADQQVEVEVKINGKKKRLIIASRFLRGSGAPIPAKKARCA